MRFGVGPITAWAGKAGRYRADLMPMLVTLAGRAVGRQYQSSLFFVRGRFPDVLWWRDAPEKGIRTVRRETFSVRRRVTPDSIRQGVFRAASAEADPLFQLDGKERNVNQRLVELEQQPFPRRSAAFPGHEVGAEFFQPLPRLLLGEAIAGRGFERVRQLRGVTAIPLVVFCC